MVRSKKDVRAWQLNLVCDGLHIISLKVSHPDARRPAIEAILDYRRNIVWPAVLLSLLYCIPKITVASVRPKDADSGTTPILASFVASVQIHPFARTPFRNGERQLIVVAETLVSLKTRRVLTQAVIVHPIEITNPDCVVELVKTTYVVVVRMGADKPSNSLPLGYPGNLCEELPLPISVYAAVNYREIIRSVVNIEKIPLANRKRFNDRHSSPLPPPHLFFSPHTVPACTTTQLAI